MPRCRVVLADLDRPCDTSILVACDDAETAAALGKLRTGLLRRRKALVEHPARNGDLDTIVAALRRLQNPQLAAYRKTASLLVVSEPFNGIASAASRAKHVAAYDAVRVMFGGSPPMRIVRALAAFGEAALESAVRAGVCIAIVPDERRYADYSPAVAKLVPGIDDWSAPPSGLFVVEEKRVLLRGRAMAMTAAHEFAHALDSVLAVRPRSYFSYESEELRYYFATATGFVNEYAASGLDEYFAESMRAYLEINDSRCAWLPLTRQDLYMRDPRMFSLIERLFASRFEARERRLINRS